MTRIPAEKVAHLFATIEAAMSRLTVPRAKGDAQLWSALNKARADVLVYLLQPMGGVEVEVGQRAKETA